jgi:hypothetical protein
MDVYIDRVFLLKKDEMLPELSDDFKAEVAELCLSRKEFKAYDVSVAAIDQYLKNDKMDTVLRSWIKYAKLKLEIEYNDVVRQIRLAAINDSLDSRIRDLAFESERIVSLIRFFTSYSCVVKERPDRNEWADSGVAVASSMVKVMPRVVAPEIYPAKKVSLQLARNEKESFQVAVVPFSEKLTDVQVEVGELKSKSGEIFPSDKVSCDVVGYVKTTLPVDPRVTYGPHVGWWPDPILSFMKKTDVAKGDVQSFWIRMAAPKDIAPGEYVGQVSVLSSAKKTPYIFDLSVNVFDFELPDISPLPLSISFRENQLKLLAASAEENYSEELWGKKWQKLKFVWADFLADYYITYDSPYGRGEGWPDFEVIDYLDKKGKLGRFNLGGLKFGPSSDEKLDEWTREIMTTMKPAYENAKQRGLLDKAYIYGFDERPEDYFPLLEKLAERVKKEMPGVEIITTAGSYWDYWGEADHIDTWCPILSNWDVSKVDKHKKEGKDVWWYVCFVSAPPFPNTFVDEAVIDTRVLMGVMTYKYKPDGFLYYCINRYNGYEPDTLVKNEKYITSGPYTQWNPKSFKDVNGDGSWTFAGPGGIPLASMRLEMFRDGLDDYGYFRILEKTVKKLKDIENRNAVQQKWLEKAEQALIVPADIVTGLQEYTRDPDMIKFYRLKLARLIETVPGIEPASLD